MTLILNSDEYESSQGKTLDRFFSSTKESFTHPEVLKMWLVKCQFSSQTIKFYWNYVVDNIGKTKVMRIEMKS